MQRHLLTHTGEKPFPCEWDGCGAVFGQKVNMKKHMDAHNGVMFGPCKWTGCDHMSVQKGNLARHERICTHRI
jgi:uncharacterized Zn-finger protein